MAESVQRAHLNKKVGFRGESADTIQENTMQADVLFRILKGLSWVVIALMLIGILYASFISVKYWAGIGV